ncbi:MAG: DUF448 domain-containing protein [Myxococcales bacterium]|nr:DUF448 domain-containing protein [Myxococcales bacterium]
MSGHVPIRRCVACGARKPQAELLRFFRRADGTLTLTTDTRHPGRGAYCCSAEACRRKAIEKRLLGKKLKAATTTTSEQELSKLASDLAAKRRINYGVDENGENHR